MTMSIAQNLTNYHAYTAQGLDKDHASGQLQTYFNDYTTTRCVSYPTDADGMWRIDLKPSDNGDSTQNTTCSADTECANGICFDLIQTLITVAPRAHPNPFKIAVFSRSLNSNWGPLKASSPKPPVVDPAIPVAITRSASDWVDRELCRATRRVGFRVLHLSRLVMDPAMLERS